MYQKYLVVASKLDKAGINITTQLSQFRENPVLSGMKKSAGFDFYLVDEEIIYTENLDLEKINKYDFVIFASKHKSRKGEKALTVHAPGNFRNNELGGEKGKVCRSSAVFMKQIFEKLKQNADEHSLKDYNVFMEATHHGPLIDKPCVFIEVGGTETEWNDRRACFVVAKTISDIINEFRENPYNEIAIAIGGGHYCLNFNKIQMNSNVAISHVVPDYVFPLTEEMVKEAIAKTEEEVDFFLLDWKGLGNSEKREEITDILKKFYLQYKKTSEVGK
ncbi:MAG: D-aminoacyl-tRNA deacylase [archaeon]